MDNLIDTLWRVLAAKRARDTAMDNYEGYWDYSGHDTETELESATKDFEKEFNSYIDERIVGRLKMGLRKYL